jgi:hypothetical protein
MAKAFDWVQNKARDLTLRLSGQLTFATGENKLADSVTPHTFPEGGDNALGGLMFGPAVPILSP